jgi:hypothetical protein
MQQFVPGPPFIATETSLLSQMAEVETFAFQAEINQVGGKIETVMQQC